MQKCEVCDGYNAYVFVAETDSFYCEDCVKEIQHSVDEDNEEVTYVRYR